MKSLIAVLVLSAALGAGYWKMQNPDGGVIEARAQADQVLTRLKSGVAAGVEAIRTGGKDPREELANELQQKLSLQATDTDTRLSALQLATEETENKVSGQLRALSATLTESVSETQNQATTEIARLNEDVDSKIGNVANQVQSQSEALAALQSASDKRIAELELQIADLTKSSNATLQSSVGTLRDSVNQELENLKAGNQNASVALDTFTEKLASLDTRLDTLSSAAVSAAPAATSSSVSSSNGDETEDTENTVNEAVAADLQAGLSAVTAQVDRRLAAMEERLAAATDADLQSSVAELDTALTDSQSNTRRLEAVIGQNQGRSMQLLGNTQRELKTLKTALETLQTELNDSRSAVQALESQVTALQGENQNSSIIESQKVLREQVTKLEELVKKNNSNNPAANTAASNTASAANADSGAVNAALAQTLERIRTLEQRVTSMPASSSNASEQQLKDELQNQIAALEQKLIDTASEPDQEIISTLSEVQQKLSELASREYVTADELQKLNETKSIQYKIYFRVGSIQISDAAKKVLDSFIAQEANRATSISVFGTTDRSGSSEFNQQLALRRANSVRSYLIQRGFDFTKIRDVDGIGEDLAAQVLPDGGNDPNQRSVIIFAFQP